ncbi:MAG TPA: LuxR C-terminal-related transcriptional regulator [Acidimicrobiales bacterium]|nr:LuxR C-terminal-related transcriptional regulator [Acidimicrobiales bacterium]
MGSPGVSRREQDVLAALGERLTNAEIASRLYISVRTVETHVSALLRKFDASNRRELADIAREREQSQRANRRRSPVRLPSTLTSFFGRNEELRGLTAVLATSRLVTLTGPAGVGKTRLAVELAARLAPTYEGGLWFVDFARAADGAELIETVAAVLDVRAEPGRTLRRAVADRLAGASAPLLLVLDNCEHVVAQIAEIALAALEASDVVTILATSRERLAVQGERVLPLAPLDRTTATQLFTDRATALEPSFAVDRVAEDVIGSICHRLDGLPLAIELAAAQIATLTPQQIDTRLADRFGLLRAPRRGDTARHEALSTALEWSYDLLEPTERAVLDRLGVFRGRFGIDAAEAVVSGPPVETTDVAEVVSRLVRKSLVVAERVGDERRFRLLESVREYSWARLVADGDTTHWQNRHLDWVLGLLDDAAKGVTTDGQLGWFDRLDEELPNVEAALEWSVHDAEASARALHAVQNVRSYWYSWGVRPATGVDVGSPWRLETGARWLEATAAAAAAAGRAHQAAALLDGVIVILLHDRVTAARLSDAAGVVADDDPRARPFAELASAFVAIFGGGPDGERQALSAVSAFPPHEPLHWWAKGLVALGLGGTGQVGRAAAGLLEVSQGFRGVGEEHLAGAWTGLACDFLLASGDSSAGAQNDYAQEVARQFRCASCECQAAANRVLVHGEVDPAQRLAWSREAVRLAHAIGETWNVLGGLEVLVGALADAGLPAEALLLGAATISLRRMTGFVPLMPSRTAAIGRGISLARAKFEPDAVAALERDGAAMDYEAAVALALS